MNEQDNFEPPGADPQNEAAVMETDAPLPFSTVEYGYGPAFAPQPDAKPDPDHPRWGAGAGIAAWLISVASIVVLPLIAVMIWYFIELARGMQLSSDKEVLREWATSPNVLFISVLSTIVAHGLTIAVCWAIVTQMGKRPLFQSLGWDWGGKSAVYWLLFSAAATIGLIAVTIVLARVLPQKEGTDFDILIKSSARVRIAVVILATFSAPLVEEMVYRGVLFAGLRVSLGAAPAVIIVTACFTGVHLLQYWGAWVSISGLLLLSLTLTLVRARTRSILPCVTFHLVNNAFQSVLILIGKG